MNGNYFVYKHTSPSGKIYIGITRQADPNRRWLSGHGYRYNTHFFNAIQKYGWPNIAHEIVARNLTMVEACQVEKDLIQQYDSANRNFGYNVSPGGGAHSRETDIKIAQTMRVVFGTPAQRLALSERAKKRWTSTEYRARQSAAQSKVQSNALFKQRLSERTRRRWSDPAFYARECERRANTTESAETKKQRSDSLKNYLKSEEARKQRSDTAKKQWADKNKMPICPKSVRCTESGIVYESTKEACEAAGASRSQIYACCNKRKGYKTAAGYHWEWVTP